MVPNAASRHGQASQRRLEHLARITHERAQLEEQRVQLVRELRRSDVSWSLIGWAVGMTSAGASRRYRQGDLVR